MSGSEKKESLPPTPESHPQDDFSDESAASDSRKYQRGGRKKSTSARQPRKSRMPPVPQPEVDDEEEQYEQAERELIQDEPDEAIGESVEDQSVEDPASGYYEEEGEKDESATGPTHRENTAKSPEGLDFCTNCSAPLQSKPTKTAEPKVTKPPESPFETGIKAFNLKRAEHSGGRPIGVRAHPTSDKKKKKSKKSKKSKKKGKKPMDESDSEEESDESEDELRDQKPMSIRLDLNLMVQIFLKAKIKGDVTITFLD